MTYYYPEGGERSRMRGDIKCGFMQDKRVSPHNFSLKVHFIKNNNRRTELRDSEWKPFERLHLKKIHPFIASNENDL